MAGQSTQPPGGFEHPEELLPWYANGTLEGDELRQVEEHLASCLACRREVQQLEALRGGVKEASDPSAGQGAPGGEGLERLMAALDLPEAAGPDAATETQAADDPKNGPKVVPFRRPQSQTQRRTQRSVPRAFLALAALLMVAVGFQVYRTWTAETPPPIVRGEEQAALRSLVEDGESLPREEFVLRWQAAELWQDATFSVYLTTADLRTLYEARGLDAASVEIPAEALADVASGDRLLWRVEAVRPDGASERSKTFVVVLK